MLVLAAMGGFAVPAFAQRAAAAAARAAERNAPKPERVVSAENVRVDYAQVLHVEPLYETLRATRTEERCDPPTAGASVAPVAEADKGVITRALGSVKELFTREKPVESAAKPAPLPRNCRIVQVGREFTRPIAYDVDYVYKGTKYRSRLAEDPGNRLRIRVAVMPYMGDPDGASP